MFLRAGQAFRPLKPCRQWRAFVSTYSKTLRSLAVAFSVAALAEASAMPSADADQRSIRCDRTRIAGDGPVRVCESKARVTIEPALDGAGRDLPDEALAPASFLARAHRSGAELKTQLDLAFGARLQSESRPGRRRERHRGGFRAGGGGRLLEGRPAAGKRKRRERRNGEFHGLCPHSAPIFPQSRSAGNGYYILNGSYVKSVKHAGWFARSISTYVN